MTAESHTGSWWSYPIYLIGVAVGAFSPEEWLVILSLVAVVMRIVIDLPRFLGTWDDHRPFRKAWEKVKSWFL